MDGWKFVTVLATIAALLGGVPAASQAPGPDSPVAPFRIAGNIYSVGVGDETSFLIVGRQGMILLDGGFARSAPGVLANIRALGFDPGKIRLLLNSQAHQDHAGALAEIKARTGALMLASRADADLLRKGGHGDPQWGDELTYPPVQVDRLVADRERVTLGEIAVTAHLTPGHTRGCTTWSLPVSEGGRTLQALFVCGASAPGYRLAGNPAYPGIVRDFRSSFAYWKRLRCEIFLGAHGSYFGMERKRALIAEGRPNSFVDPLGYRNFLAKAQAAIEEQLRLERSKTR